MSTSWKLRQSGDSSLNKLVEKYTVWDDYVWDQQLIPFDVQASLAHATMLESIWIITHQELNIVWLWLNQILELRKKGEFIITQSQEDWHTAIEQYLTENCWEVGKKIHTGRSRNDQSLVMIRLFMKSALAWVIQSTQKLILTMQELSEKTKSIPMPWYTHTQKAMPTTVWIWLGSYIDSLTDGIQLIKNSFHVIDQNPLWSASWFGINNLELDRTLTSNLMWFGKTQENPLYCWLSRWLFESTVLWSLSHLMITLWRFANDMIMFTTQEFDFFALPVNFTTGSSIMPQKRNYDLFEIMRWNTKIFLWYLQQIQWVIMSIGSWYHRDLQLTKKPFVLWMELCKDTVDLLIESLPQLIIKNDKLNSAMTDDLFATDRVYELVKQGMSFRDAYQKVKEELFG